jgi:hypothetical protein
MKPRERRYLARLLGESTAGRGRVSEELLLAAVRRAGASLPWFLFAREANAEEDARGIDIVVFARGDLRIFLQAKSSHGKAIAFKTKQRKAKIEVVVVSLDEEKNLRRAKMALENAYAESGCRVEVGAQTEGSS